MAEQTDDLSLEWEPRGNKIKVMARRSGEAVHVDTIDPASANSRQRFINKVVEKLPQANPSDIDSELLRIADNAGKKHDVATTNPESPNAAELLSAMPQDIREEAARVLKDELLIQQIVDDIAELGVAGECELTATVYLIGVSRLLDRPLAGIVQGPSSSGKSHLIDRTATLFPSETVIRATQMTPQALFHMPPTSLVHRFVVAGERSRIANDDSAEATRALREMLSAGKLTKLMPMKGEGGVIQTVKIEQDGPVAFVESTTLSKIFDEDANRCLLLNTDEQPEQTRRVIKKLGAAYAGAATINSGHRVIAVHHAMQRMLEPVPVVVPFADRIGEKFNTDRVEARRAFPQVISMVRSFALLYQMQRLRDIDGRIMANEEDYRLAHRLLAKPISRLLGGACSEPARRFFDRLVRTVTGNFTIAQVTKDETYGKSTVHGWNSELHAAGFVMIVEASRGRTPTTWRLTGKTPDDTASICLPRVEDVFPESARTHGYKPQLVAAS